MSFRTRTVANFLAAVSLAGSIAASSQRVQAQDTPASEQNSSSTIEGPSYFVPEVQGSVFTFVPSAKPIDIRGLEDTWISPARLAAAKTLAQRRALFAPPACDTSGLLTPGQIESRLQLCHDIEFGVDHSP